MTSQITHIGADIGTCFVVLDRLKAIAIHWYQTSQYHFILFLFEGTPTKLKQGFSASMSEYTL